VDDWVPRHPFSSPFSSTDLGHSQASGHTK
jgi:hypothetical protein